MSPGSWTAPSGSNRQPSGTSTASAARSGRNRHLAASWSGPLARPALNYGSQVLPWAGRPTVPSPTPRSSGVSGPRILICNRSHEWHAPVRVAAMVIGWRCKGTGELTLDTSRQRSIAHERRLIRPVTVPSAVAAQSRRERGGELAMGAMPWHRHGPRRPAGARCAVARLRRPAGRRRHGSQDARFAIASRQQV